MTFDALVDETDACWHWKHEERVAPTLVRKQRCYQYGVIRTRVGVACDKRLDRGVNSVCLLCYAHRQSFEKAYSVSTSTSNDVGATHVWPGESAQDGN